MTATPQSVMSWQGKKSSEIPVVCQQGDIQLPGENMSVLDLAADAVTIIQDIKKLSHFKDKNKLVHNVSCQQNMKI